jgi:hypothetical protein
VNSRCASTVRLTMIATPGSCHLPGPTPYRYHAPTRYCLVALPTCVSGPAVGHLGMTHAPLYGSSRIVGRIFHPDVVLAGTRTSVSLPPQSLCTPHAQVKQRIGRAVMC